MRRQKLQRGAAMWCFGSSLEDGPVWSERVGSIRHPETLSNQNYSMIPRFPVGDGIKQSFAIVSLELARPGTPGSSL